MSLTEKVARFSCNDRQYYESSLLLNVEVRYEELEISVWIQSIYVANNNKATDDQIFMI